jgi:hypothetical protein
VKRALALALLVAALVAPTAQAHRYLTVNTTTAYYERKMENRINAYRLGHGRWLLLDALNLHLAGISLSWANYNEARYTTSIGGVPWAIWNDDFLTPDQQFFNVMMTRRKCYGLPLTPYQVMKRWTNHRKYRYALLNPTATTIGIRVVYLHRHVGDWAGLGRCTVYYVSIAS